MKKITILAIIGALSFTAVSFASPPHPPPVIPVNVTFNPIVQTYLDLAIKYWNIRLPSRYAPCNPETVIVQPMVEATGNDNAQTSGNQIWAETGLDSCEIDLSPSFWAFLSGQDAAQGYFIYGPHRDRAFACAIIAHEYGHTLGLPDTAHGIGLENGNGNSKLDDPLCNLYALGWAHISHSDRLWLIGANLSLTGP